MEEIKLNKGEVENLIKFYEECTWKNKCDHIIIHSESCAGIGIATEAYFEEAETLHRTKKKI